MQSRRWFIQSVASLAAGGATAAGCQRRDGNAPSYDELVTRTWRFGAPGDVTATDASLELVRYATLAANSHNSQPWLFRLGTNVITVLPDLRRRCPAVDPDDHHLYASLGCAAENLVQAANALGFATNLSVVDKPDCAEIRIELQAAKPIGSDEFLAIPQRQSTRAEFDRRAVPADELRTLEASTGSDPVMLQVLTSPASIEQVAEYVVAGNTVQMHDDAFMEELRSWLRFNAAAAAASCDGLYSVASGNPELPDWLGSLMFRLAYRAESENPRYAAQVRSSSGVAIFAASTAGRSGWVAAGRCCQRFALKATSLGLKCAFVNQPVEVPKLRAQFASYLGMDGARPDLVMRFGHGPTLPRSLRRPVEAVIVTG